VTEDRLNRLEKLVDSAIIGAARQFRNLRRDAERRGRETDDRIDALIQSQEELIEAFRESREEARTAAREARERSETLDRQITALVQSQQHTEQILQRFLERGQNGQ